MYFYLNDQNYPAMNQPSFRCRVLRLTCLLMLTAAFRSPLLAQSYNPVIDVQHYEFSLQLSDSNDLVKATASVALKFRQDAPSFSLDLVKKNSAGKGMVVRAVTEAGRKIRFGQDNERLTLYSTAKAGESHRYTIQYAGIPADGLIIAKNKFGRRGFFGDNWPNRAHNWLPCVDHPSDKATVDFLITAPDHYEVVANGKKIKETLLPGHLKLTRWNESVPLSPKVMVIGVADFAVDHPGDVQGIPIYSYVFKENRETGFRSYAVATEILPFYIKKIGPYAYEKLGNVQSKTRFGGLENASAIFYFENSVDSKGIESLMAHEIAHQWFGDAATETEWHHLWLSEGFATYMTHCYLENKYGIDTLKKGLASDRSKLIAYEKRRNTPVVDTAVKSDYMQLLNPNSYEKGGWVLHMLRRKLGDERFWKGIDDYFASYKNRNASTEDLQHVMEAAGGQPLDTFFHQWLYTPGHPSLSVSWKFEAATTGSGGTLVMEIRQRQNTLFEFPLEFSVDGSLHTVPLKDRTTSVSIPVDARPSALVMDPNVNALADFEVSGQ